MNQENQKSPSWIIQTEQETFQVDVIARSHQTPVVLDFWAAWCQPCRTLTPILEKLAEEFAGQFALVKAETDRNPEAAEEFNVQSIPAVYGVVDGEVVDFFQGVMPEESVRQWISQLLLLAMASRAKRLEETDPQAAEEKYRQLAEKLPNDSTGAIGLARVTLAQGRADEARGLIERLEQRGFLEPEAEKIKAALELQAHRGDDLDAIRQAFEKEPDDLQLQLNLAEALAAQSLYEEALQVSLEIVQKDRQDLREQARRVMVDIFRVLPDDSELTGQYRRKLSSALY